MIKDMDEVFKQADDLLYQSKESGRDRVSINAV
jgi:PleD family two-component response regulator